MKIEEQGNTITIIQKYVMVIPENWAIGNLTDKIALMIYEKRKDFRKITACEEFAKEIINLFNIKPVKENKDECI